MDRTFVQGMVESQVDEAIVRAVIDLADAMGIATVAEGVETRSQVAGLKMIGCEVAQGFYFSPPLCAEEFDQLLTRHFAVVADLPRTPGGPAGPGLTPVPLAGERQPGGPALEPQPAGPALQPKAAPHVSRRRRRSGRAGR